MDVSTYSVYQFAGAQGFLGIRAYIVIAIPPRSRALLRFYPDNATIPKSLIENESSANPNYTVNYPYSQYAGVLDLLRNEKPITFVFEGGTGLIYVGTSAEPVGEAE
jgi:hypothetical protein